MQARIGLFCGESAPIFGGDIVQTAMMEEVQALSNPHTKTGAHDDVRILVVDDRADKAKSLEAVISDLGTVIVATSGRDALRILMKESVAVILLDVRMPVMDGFETAQLIRKRASTESTPIIFITSYNDSDTSRGYSLGAVDYMVAPVVPEILRAKVTVFVELYRKTEEVKKSAEERVQLVHEQIARVTAEAAKKSAQEAEQRAQFLAEATGLLVSSLDADAMLSKVVGLAVPQLADWCCIHLAEDEGFRLISSPHASAPRQEELTKLHLSCITSSEGPVRAVIASGQSAYIANLDSGDIAPAVSETCRAELRRAQIRSYIVAPMVARTRSYGTLTMSTEAGRMFSRADLAMAEDLAKRVAISLDNSRLYREAHEANRAKDEFLAMVSHELRTPLTPIIGWSRMISSGKLSSEDISKGIRIIERNVRSQAKLIDDLLDVSRITSGKLRLSIRSIDAGAAVQACVESVRSTAEASSLELTATLPREPAIITGDDHRLQQIILNLLSNALKFTPVGGKVFVSCEIRDQHVEIVVKDTGRGIDAQFLPLVFERFRQADSTSTRAYGGLGLGLAIVRHLVELHGGTITAESEGADKGARFTVQLPLADRGVSAPAVTKSSLNNMVAVPEIQSLAGTRIMIVDDEPDAREIVRTVLEKFGAEVHEAASASETLSALERFHPDILISDINMPGKDGYALIGEIRNGAWPKLRNIPAVALSAAARDEDRVHAECAGYQLHLAKPVEPEALVSAIMNFVVAKKDTPA